MTLQRPRTITLPVGSSAGVRFQLPGGATAEVKGGLPARDWPAGSDLFEHPRGGQRDHWGSRSWPQVNPVADCAFRSFCRFDQM